MSAFPVDDVTLAMVEAACTASDDGPSQLADFLSFGAVHVGAYEHEDTMDGIEMWVGGWHHNHVILALIAEVRSIRYALILAHAAALQGGYASPQESAPVVAALNSGDAGSPSATRDESGRPDVGGEGT